MDYDEEFHDEDEDPKRRSFTIVDLNRIVAILFVFSVYLFIFLKILVLN